jgi:hypothetical protein
MLGTVTQAPIDLNARPRRRLGCVGIGLSLAAGSVLGYVAAAVVDAATTVEWRGVWTTAAVGGGAALGLGAVVALVFSGRTTDRQVRRAGHRLWKLYEPVSLLATLGTLYAGIWVVGPQLTRENVLQFALVGVVAWPMIAGTVRILFGRPPLRPPWWAGLWVLLGAGPTAFVLQLRADHLPTRFDGVIGGVVLLVPVAVWRFVRTRRRLVDR